VLVLVHVLNTISDPVFQQNKATIRSASIISEWLDENNITVLNQSPYSPDLNPLEHVWVELKKRLHYQYPDIATTAVSPKKVKEWLATVLPEVWETIPLDFFENLWRSMPSRVQAVLDTKGWYTQY